MTRASELLELCGASPAHGLEVARMGILDCVGCIVGGSATATARKVRELAQEQGRVAAASVLGTRERLAAPLAALANGVAGHVLDYDDMNSTLVGHPSVVLVPATFALAEARGASGADVLGAYLAGFEVDTWFGRQMIPRHYDSGWHATSSLGIFGATAACSRLLGLDANATLNALAIAASNVAGLRANFGSETKSLHAGQAAEGGLRAALLAARGFGANPSQAFDGPGGFFDAYAANPKPKPHPGRTEIEASGIGIKPYACCGAGVSLIDAALDLRCASRLDPREIVSVDCAVSEMAARIMPFGAASDSLQAKYCLAYCAAVALLDAAGGLAQFEDHRVRAPDVQQLLARVTVRPDPAMASGAGRFGVEMRVRLKDGRMLETALDVPRGHPARPLEAARLTAKFMECSAPVVGEANAREAAARLQRLESLQSLSSITSLLVPAP